MKLRLLFLIGIFISASLSGQDQEHNFNKDNADYIYVSGNNKATSEDEIVKIIVQFKALPLVKQVKTYRSTSEIDNYASRLVNDLKSISRKFSKSKSVISSEAIKINKEFNKVFSGVQIDVPKSYLPAISGLEYVKKLYVDKKITAYLDDSVPLINADKIWQEFNNKGEGIKICIIDTGIDYLHEALGQGYGPGYKVIGGYDFVNQDDDPMDDHGHGTHVAGIAAANSPTLQGVAPDALLLACKVLDANGSGYSSSTIEAIEYSIDPNDDNDFSDAVDVINLSLGGYGTPDDPSSQAVNNAAELGIVVCLAAGNEGGLGFNTIGSPGCAEKAITVGNATKLKVLQTSSSKGPNQSDFRIKPDILAPGSNISSAQLNGGVISFTGTSMAAPHLAGVCALIRKQHPDWTPDEIKSAVKTTAEVLDYEPMEQGSGFVNAYKAITAGTFAIPSDLSFGLCDTTNTIWAPSETIIIKNKSAVQQQYNVNISSGYSGINFNVDNPSFSLLPGDSTNINVTLNVDNTIVDYINTGSNSYSGYCQIVGEYDTLSLPWAFVKKQVIELRFECPYADFQLAGVDKRYLPYDANWIDLYTAQLTVPAGEYDLFSYMVSGDSVLFNVKTGLNLTGTDIITILKNESKNQIHLDAENEFGTKITELDNSYFLIILFNKEKYRHYQGFFNNNVNYNCFITDVPDNVVLHCDQYNIDNNETYTILAHEPVSGITSDLYLTIKPDELVKKKVNFLFDKNTSTPAISFYINMEFQNNQSETLGFGDLGFHTGIPEANWEGYVVRNERLINNPTFEFRLRAVNSYPPGDWGYSFASAPMWAKDSKIFMSANNEITPDIFVEQDPAYPIIVGDDILYANANYTISYNYVQQRVYFRGQLNDLRSIGGNKYKYKIYNSEDEIIDSGETELFDNISTFDAWGDIRTEYYQTDHSRFTDSSMAMLTSFIRNNEIDRTPPSITSFQIRNSEGRPIDKIGAEENIQIRFSLDDSNLDESMAKIEVKDYAGGDWIHYETVKLAEHEKIGSLFTAELDSSVYKNTRLLSVRISGEDSYSNRCEWLLDPAIKVNKGNFYAPQFDPISDLTINEDDSVKVDFVCNDGDNDTLIFSANANTEGFVIEVENNSLKIVPPLNWHGAARISITASDGKYSTSTEFTLNVTSINDRPEAFSLVSPSNGASVEINTSSENDSLYFNWTASSDVDGDSLQYLFVSEIDSIVIHSIATSNNTVSYSYMDLKNLLSENRSVSLIWAVFVSDGMDTTYADNNNFSLNISKNYPPEFSPIEDYTMNEDDSLTVPFNCMDPDGDPLLYSASSTSTEFQLFLADTSLKLAPPANWFGDEEILLTASDGKYIDSTRFAVHVMPVNDSPGGFNLLTPENETGLEITGANVHDTLKFSWSNSEDVDEDTLIYILNMEIDSVAQQSITTGELNFNYPITDLIFLIGDVASPSIVWDVSVTDGTDTTVAVNNSFVLNISHDPAGIDEDQIPREYYLYNAFPNPFNPSTVIKYDVPEESHVTLRIFDPLGRIVDTIVDEVKPAGKYTIQFNGYKLSSGIYFYQMVSKKKVFTKKLILIK